MQHKSIFLTQFLCWFFLSSVGQPIVDIVPFTLKSLPNVEIITHGGDERLFVATGNGLIYIVNDDGTILEDPFLDLSERIVDSSLTIVEGLAFHPEFTDNGLFYLYYSKPDGARVLSSFEIDDRKINQADPDSEKIILIYNQPLDNMRGGDIQFGPDGFLYLATADAGNHSDPILLAQKGDSFLGKILRIDVNQSGGYIIPTNNPYKNDKRVLDEIFASGLHNPGKLVFDELNGSLWISDSGDRFSEELNVLYLDSEKKYNFGWPCYEGSFNPGISVCENEEMLTAPVIEYTHSDKGDDIIGGEIYRGQRYPALWGNYIFADGSSGIFYRIVEGEEDWEIYELPDMSPFQPKIFGKDVAGEIYVYSEATGLIHKLIEFCQAYQPYLTLVDNGTILMELESAFWSGDFTVEWYLDDMLINEPLDSLLYTESSGDYYVNLIHERGCFLQSETLKVISYLPALNWKENISIWPNPFTNSFTLEWRANIELDAVIIDSDGRQVDSQVIPPDSRITWNTNIPRGIYTIQLVAANGSQFTQQIVRK